MAVASTVAGASELGDLLEVTHQAPRCQTVHLRGTTWNDPDAFGAAMSEWSRHGGVVVARYSSGDGAPSPPPLPGEPFELWWDRDRGLRTAHGDGFEVRARGIVTTFHPMSGAIQQPERDDARLPVPVPLAARAVLSDLDFELLGSERRGERAAWRVAATPTAQGSFGPPPFWVHQLPGRDYVVGIDKETGVILLLEGRLDGELSAQLRIDDVEIDGPIADDLFRFRSPDGTPVRTPTQVMLEQLAQQGVDVSDIDPTDPEQIHTAVRRQQESVFAMHRPPSVEQLAENIPVLGPPPMDEESARAAVGDAFARMAELSDDGGDVVMVERGTDLGDCVRAARERAGRTGEATFEVRHLKFVSDREAVVWYAVAIKGGTLLPEVEGRAVLTEAGWRVTRATFCQLMRMAGVTCPPPAPT